MISAAENPQKRRKLNEYNGGDIPLDGDVIEVLYVRFIAACNMLLCLIEYAEFRAFLSYLNKDIDRWLNHKHYWYLPMHLREIIGINRRNIVLLKFYEGGQGRRPPSYIIYR